MSLAVILGGSWGLISAGCGVIPTLCERGGCADGQYATGCDVGSGPVQVFCTSVPSEGETSCAAIGGFYAGTELCDSGATSGASYPGYDPDAAINLVSGVYEVDSDFVDEVRSDFNMVTQEDNARIDFLSTGYAKLINVDSDDMVSHLGFQNNDIILSVTDGVTGVIYLNGWADYMDAAVIYSSTTSLSVDVLRGSSTVTLSYDII